MRQRLPLAVAIAAFTPFAPRGLAVTLHVPADHPTIQTCIDAAASGKDECLIAPGTYNERIDFLGKTITVRSSDGPEVTILDGFGLFGAIVTCTRGEAFGTVLDGFTIMRGTAAQFGGEYGGGGMLNYQSSPTVSNCVFRKNSGNIGAAMFNYVFANPTITDCRFLENHAHLGGAIINYVHSSPVITDCTFEDNNTVNGLGGAMENFVESRSVISGCAFRRNTAYRGGAVYNDWNSPTTFINCSFEENTATYGGAIYDEFNSPSFLDHCVFVRNIAMTNGGAIDNEYGSEETIVGCEFIDNQAFGVGGAISNAELSSWGDLTIADCRFTSNKAGEGGALYVNGAKLSLSNGVFDDNQAVGNGGALYVSNGAKVSLSNGVFDDNQAGGNGGAIYQGDSRLLITTSRFSNNTGTNGGGIFSLGGNSTITGSSFQENMAENWGGGIYDAFPGNHYGSTQIRDCVFLRNTAREGGGYYNEGVSLLLSRSTFQQNSAEHGGGLVFIGKGGEISHCLFEGNSATDRGGGLSMFNFGLSAALTDCTFLGNRASMGGGIHNVSDSVPSITNCLFSNNLADAGGGIFEDGDGAVRRCSFRSNRAISGGGLFVLGDGATTADSLFVGNSAFSGAVLFAFENTAMARCTLIANQAEYTGGVADGSGAALTLSDCILRENSPDLIGADQFTATLRFSDIQDGVPAHCTDGGGNIDVDPLFVRTPSGGGDGWGDDPATPGVDESANDDYGDLHLQPGSPCINAGDPNYVPAPGATDFDGHARVLCGRVDMGAYEFGIGDFDCDQSVNASDLFAWRFCSTDPAVQTLMEGRCEAFDFDADGDIDLRDLARFMLIVTP